MKNVALIGSGGVAEAFARAFQSNPFYRPVQIFARNASRRGKIASIAGCGHTGDPSELAPADIYLICVSDDAISAVAASLDFPHHAVVAHTAGSVSVEAIPESAAHRGAFYPLQTFTPGRGIFFREVPIFIEGVSERAVSELKSLAASLSDNVFRADLRQREAIHLSAVFACNFTNAMYAIGQYLIRESGADSGCLRPLISETAAKAAEAPYAAGVQTGPARRGDEAVMEKHLSMLENRPELKEIYKSISKIIWETSKRI